MKTYITTSTIIVIIMFFGGNTLAISLSHVESNVLNKATIIIDSTEFQFANAKYSEGEKTSNFVNADGFSVRYPSIWERDYRSTEDLLLYLRPYNEKAPYIFREILTISNEGLADSEQEIKDYAEMMLSITEDTWSRYDVNVSIATQEAFEVNGYSAYRVRLSLPRLSQEHLLVFFKYNSKAYTIEYIATDVSYDTALESVWKLINSLGFVEK